MDQKNVHLITTVICGISSGEFFLVTTVVDGDFEKKFEINGKKIKFIQDQHKGPAWLSLPSDPSGEQHTSSTLPSVYNRESNL